MSERSISNAPARSVALRTLVRIDTEGAYANLVLRGELDRSGLSPRDRAFTTELVYGTTRLRRRLDHVVDRFLLREVDPPVRAALRLGAYQLHELGTPPHAAVSATVEAVKDRRVRGLVNAVLRKVADAPVAAWPSEAVRLSYPDWLVDRLVADLGAGEAAGALAAMNEPASATERDDGYVQDRASQWVADLVGSEPGERVADLCAAPGGKATALAGDVVAADHTVGRIGLVASNAERLGRPLRLLVADAATPPFRAAVFDRVLVDAPCSGLGTLRRRADARWRIDEAAVERLATLQRRILAAAATLVPPGGTLVYSVCTLTEAEGPDVAATLPWTPLPSPDGPWQPWGSGAVLLPQAAGTDGMFVARWQAPESFRSKRSSSDHLGRNDERRWVRGDESAGVIATDGVVTLRAPEPADAATLVAGRDTEFHQFLNAAAGGSSNPYAVIVVDDAVVGWVDWDVDRTWLERGEVNVGYNVFAEHRGRGYATRAVALLLHALHGRATTATLLIHPDNERSLALAARAGFERQPDLDGLPYFKKPVPPRPGRTGRVQPYPAR